MTLVVKDRVREITTTTGTGSVVLAGAVTGFQGFSVIGNGNTTYYTISDSTSGAWEVGIGTYTASSSTLSRDTVLESSSGGAAVNFGAGAKDVFVTYPAEYSFGTGQVLPVANGGTGTDTPSLVAGTNVTISGSWPNQTIDASGGGGSGAEVGQVVFADDVPTTGTWLETGKYYSKAAYPALAATMGDIADIGSMVDVPQAQLPQPFSTGGTTNPYLTATNGTVTVAVGTAGAIRKTTDGVNWTGVPSLTTFGFTEIRYLNGNFIALGTSGQSGSMVTSTDGETWVARAIPATNTPNGANGGAFVSVTYGEGKYVAVGQFGLIAYSTDLITWTNVSVSTITLTNSFTRVAYGNSTFVAVGVNGVLFSSPDGVSWTNRLFQGSQTYNDLVFENGLFVVVTSLGAPWYSVDGIAWSSKYAVFTTTGNGAANVTVAATDGTKLIAAGANGRVFVSTDGVTWGQVRTITGNSLVDAEYLNGNFVVVGQSGAIITSTDGYNWVLRNTPGFSSMLSVAYGNGNYVAVGSSGSIWYSSNLAVWTVASGTGALQFNKVIYANSLFVAVGNTGALYTSPDGVTWTNRSTGSNAFTDVIYGNSLFVVTGNGGSIFTSPDGVTWTSQSAGTFGFSTVIFANSLFVAVGTNGGCYTSPDGVTWTVRTTNAGTALQSIVWTGTKFIALGAVGGIWVDSADGITWTRYIDASLSGFVTAFIFDGKTIAFGGGASVIIEGAARTQVLQSGTWNYAPSALNPAKPRFIAYNGSNQYAVLAGTAVLTSSDGLSWVGQNTGFGYSQGGIFYLNGNYLVFGNNNGTPIQYSSNGTTWTSSSTTFTTNFLVAAAFGASTYAIAGNAGAIWTSTDLNTWTIRSAGANAFYDITYGNSIFVAVGVSGSCYTSTDGVTWTLRTGVGAAALVRVIYANSLFVVLGTNGAIYTSPDGITWTTRTSNTANQLVDIAWSGSLFCAVGASGTIVTSPDGVTWTVRATPVTTQLFNSVSWSGSIFSVVNSTDSIVLFSTNGINWNANHTPVLNTGYICGVFAGGNFVAVGANKIAVSANGETWTPATNVQFTALPGIANAYSISYANSRFIISGQGNATNIATSSDGINWSSLFVGAIYTATSQQWYQCAWNGSSYFLVGQNGRYATSTNAVTWTANQDVSASTFNSVAVIDEKTIAFGQTSCVVLAGAARSEVLQLLTWNYTVAAQNTPNPRTIAYNGSNQYVSVGSNGVFLTSADGQSWEGGYSGVTANFDKVQHLNGNYIAMGGTGITTNLLTSSNGTTWTYRVAGAGIFNAAAFGASMYVVVGPSGAVYSSPDLATWTLRSAGANTFNDVIFANSLFVAVGASGSCFTSPDGITWTTRSAGSAQFFRIIFANSLFVAVAASGGIHTSPDGITWTSRTSGVSGQLNDIIWNGSIFCAVGASGVITTSPDGVNWTARTPGDTTVTLNSISWSGTRFIVTNTTNAVIWTSTDAITWTRVAAPYIIGNTLYSGYLGGKFLAVGTGFIQTSVNGIDWTASDPVQYVPNSINKLYFLGGKYFALTDKGMFQSNDGVSFTLSSRVIRSGPVLSMAYSGSAWVVMGRSESSQPIVFYKSTDGATWVKSSELGNLASTSTSATLSIDMVYANGNFIFGTPIVSAQGIDYTIYTSPDAVTWTGRQTPFLLAPSTTLASDGAVCLFGTNSFLACKSDDGGLTWSTFSFFGVIAGYVDGVWFLGSLASTNFADWFNISASMSGTPFRTGDFFITTSSPIQRSFGKIGVAGGIALSPILQSIFSVNGVTSNKQAVTRSSTVLLLLSRANNTGPNLLGEAPLYSYDTATTFWVPPVSGQGVMSTYIYAGA